MYHLAASSATRPQGHLRQRRGSALEAAASSNLTAPSCLSCFPLNTLVPLNEPRVMRDPTSKGHAASVALLCKHQNIDFAAKNKFGQTVGPPTAPALPLSPRLSPHSAFSRPPSWLTLPFRCPLPFRCCCRCCCQALDTAVSQNMKEVELTLREAMPEEVDGFDPLGDIDRVEAQTEHLSEQA